VASAACGNKRKTEHDDCGLNGDFPFGIVAPF